MTSVTVVGVRGHLVAVEAHVGRGLPFLTLLGLPRGGDQDAPTGSRRRPSAYAIARTRTEIPLFATRAGSANTSPKTDPAVLGLLLKVKPGLGEGYDWVECGSCGAGWQVPYYAESVG